MEEQGQEAAAADPLAHLRVANDALAMRPTDLLSRRELVAHNKELKDSTDQLRREELRLGDAAEKMQGFF